MSQNTPGTILIVDDNPYNLEVLSRRLERKGFETICVDSGEKALELIQSQDFDMMLLDIMMPGLNGMEVLREARKTFSKSELPIIMVTSKGDSQDVVDALNLGANDYVMKPIDFPVAFARIQTHLSQKREFSEMSNKPKVTYSLNEGEKFGNYVIAAKIGQGGMGAVYKAYDPNLDRMVALKVVLPGHELSPSQIERFTREARAIARIKHPNIVAVYEIGQAPQHYFTMDFIEGKNLSQLTKERMFKEQDVIRICTDIASALQLAHSKGIIHRDLKPSNIMIDDEGLPHLMDFGLAKMESEEEQLTRTGDILGTPEYMAPEQVDPAYGEVDARSDLYSLGVILYELLTGSAPFSGTPIRVLWQKLNQPVVPARVVAPQVSKPIEEICLKAMAREKTGRFQNAQEMYEALRALIL